MKEKINSFSSPSSLMNLRKLLGADWFRPESFLAFYLIYILITVASFFTGLPIKAPSLLSFIVIFVAFPFFLIGIKFGGYLCKKNIPQNIIYLYVFLISIFYAFVGTGFYKSDIYFLIILCISGFLIVYLFFKYKFHQLFSSYRIPSLLMLTGGVLLFFAFYQIGGIPLFNNSLKIALLHNTIFGASILLFVFGFTFLIPQIKDNKVFLILLITGTALFFLSLFRGAILTIFLTGIFVAYYTKKIDTKKILLLLIAALLIIFIIGYVSRPILGPAKLFLFRAGTTHTVFDTIVQKSMPFGYTHGTLFFNGDPRDFVGSEIMGKQSNLTYTVLGQAVLDFGIVGAILWMFLLGAVLKISHLNMKTQGFKGFYPLLFAVSLILIESGLDQFFLIYYFVFLMAYLATKRD